MKTNKVFTVLVLAVTFFCIGISSCTWDKPEVPDSINAGDSIVENPIDTMNNPGFNCPDYPDDVGAIIVNKCATAGCHNSVSYVASSGLNLTSWLTMRRGNDAGAVVIPGNPDYSTLFSFCNTYDDIGFTGNIPKMPLDRTPLTRDEITTLKNWINGGAKNRCGDLMFPENQSSGKFYISNQACDQVMVMDRATHLVRKLFNVGDVPGFTEAPHIIKITPDGNYLLIAFFNSGLIQRYKTSDESFVDEVSFDNGSNWGTLAISPDSKRAYAVQWYATGRIAVINLENFPMTNIISLGISDLSNPHGICFNQDGSKIYITNQNGNNFYRIDPINNSGDFATLAGILHDAPANPGYINSMGGGQNGHEIVFTPDFSKFMITCEATNEVRVFNTSDNSLFKVIPVGTFPQEFSFSDTKPYVFVSCTEDVGPQGRGSIAVIDYNTFTLVKTIYTGTQPHGLAVDDAKGVVYVANRNVDLSGPAPHHSGACEGRNGYLTIIDMNTLELVPGYKCELGVNPYSVVLKN